MLSCPKPIRTSRLLWWRLVLWVLLAREPPGLGGGGGGWGDWVGICHWYRVSSDYSRDVGGGADVYGWPLIGVTELSPLVAPHTVWGHDALALTHDPLRFNAGQAVRLQKRLFDPRVVPEAVCPLAPLRDTANRSPAEIAPVWILFRSGFCSGDVSEITRNLSGICIQPAVSPGLRPLPVGFTCICLGFICLCRIVVGTWGVRVFRWVGPYRSRPLQKDLCLWCLTLPYLLGIRMQLSVSRRRFGIQPIAPRLILLRTGPDIVPVRILLRWRFGI